MTKSTFSLSRFISESSAAVDTAFPAPGEPARSELAMVASKVSNCISPVLAASGLKQSEQKKFEVSAVDLVTSSEFIADLSGKVGVPLEGESKDQFVHRAKSELRSLLMQQLLRKK